MSGQEDLTQDEKRELLRQAAEYANWLKRLTPKKRRAVERKALRRAEHRRSAQRFAKLVQLPYRCTCHKAFATPAERAACRSAHPRDDEG